MKDKIVLFSAAFISAAVLAGTVLYHENPSAQTVKTVEVEQYDAPEMADIDKKTDIVSGSKVTKDTIYYKMLNTVDYYDRVSGTVVDANGNTDQPITVEFECDLNKISAYSKVTMTDIRNNSLIMSNENYISDMENIRINNLEKSFSKNGDVIDENEYIIPSDDERVTSIGDEYCYSYRPNATNVPEAGSCLLPQEIVFSLLTDRNAWSLNGTENYLGRECWLINGQTNDYYASKLKAERFMFLVDTKTGVLLKYEGYDSGGNIVDYVYAKEISFDDSADSVKTLPQNRLAGLTEKY